MRTLITQRMALLRLLRVVPLRSRIGLGAVMLGVCLLPAAIALAVAWLVGRAVVAADGATLRVTPASEA